MPQSFNEYYVICRFLELSGDFELQSLKHLKFHQKNFKSFKHAAKALTGASQISKNFWFSRNLSWLWTLNFKKLKASSK